MQFRLAYRNLSDFSSDQHEALGRTSHEKTTSPLIVVRPLSGAFLHSGQIPEIPVLSSLQVLDLTCTLRKPCRRHMWRFKKDGDLTNAQYYGKLSQVLLHHVYRMLRLVCLLSLRRVLGIDDV